ncbi:cupin domain-containing protein [Candidatus Parcubacteria bacterium]|nr:cupin domain-containing protein [Patescibacteria group bacterium]MBU4309309.1 cupin domain-containing protein [Patescibacteria group bacterium]MBU4432286.1 cupin domain-containing protein [Patescibacteria group bacterium]MBU4577670.1 cupin domain-containing protein [Patescibacteria group bacterium]MCG2697356.1 cupin domain-containing protein [Candidatus Parcubacteria bacterium]
MLKVNSAEIYKFADMVGYQDGSIVSREIIQKPSGTITVFAFGAGQGLSEHIAPFDALVYILDGQAEVMIDGKMSEVGQGEMIILPVNVIHALKAVQKFKMALIMIR